MVMTFWNEAKKNLQNIKLWRWNVESEWEREKLRLTETGKMSESYRSNIKEGKRIDEWGGVVQGQVRNSTTGTDRLMHKQERGGINELPSYCTQVWPPTREKGETERGRRSDEGHSWFSRGGGAGKRERLEEKLSCKNNGKKWGNWEKRRPIPLWEIEGQVVASSERKTFSATRRHADPPQVCVTMKRWLFKEVTDGLQSSVSSLLKLSCRDDFLASWHSMLKTFFCHFRSFKGGGGGRRGRVKLKRR